jgi:hypothetical protein
MFIERRVHNDRVELWDCDWEYPHGQAARKVFIRCLGVEQPLEPNLSAGHAPTEAICWSYGRTLGNIAVFSQEVLGSFTGTEGSDATLSCDFVEAGKFRHGTGRWWCRTHQCHWGTKADLAAAQKAGSMVCANHNQPMSYVVNPYQLTLDEHVEVGIWCSLPAALSSAKTIPPRPPKIHMHVRNSAGGAKIVDRDFNAVSLHYNQELGLFASSQINKVNLTPPAALEFMLSIEDGREMDCINCSHCGYPHLDLGDFGLKPHRKHFCGNCGRDSTWSKQPIVSTPLKPLHDQFAAAVNFVEPDRKLNLDDYNGCTFMMWASTPAILWTADRPQEKGIHVHVNEGTNRVVDDTFRKVIYQGNTLDRTELLKMMIARTII